MKPWPAPLLLLALTIASGCDDNPPSLGQCDSVAQAELLSDGRAMKLLADFTYIDPDGLHWDAPTGSVIDGASIPRIFWSLVGSHYIGKHREPSIVHDVACEKKERDWRMVHKMFYLACLCEGMEDFKAKMMYGAVYHFGPRWGENREPETLMDSEDDFERLQLLVATEPDVKIEDVERLTAQTLKIRVPHLPARDDPKILALPHLSRTFPDRVRGRLVTTDDPETVDFIVQNNEDARNSPREIDALRKSAATGIDAERQRVEKQIVAESDREKRAALASKLLRLNRESAAVNQVGVRVKVAAQPPP